jgi:hypothetical protein
MDVKERRNLSTAVFFIGLVALFITGWWFPGFLFLLAAALVAGAIDKGRPWHSEPLAFVFVGIGVVFGIPAVLQSINWWLVLGVIIAAVVISTLFSSKPEPMDEESDESSDDDDDDESGYI